MLQQQRVRSQPLALESQGLALAPTTEGVKFNYDQKTMA
jgi:hypothetical protein